MSYSITGKNIDQLGAILNKLRVVETALGGFAHEAEVFSVEAESLRAVEDIASDARMALQRLLASLHSDGK